MLSKRHTTDLYPNPFLSFVVVVCLFVFKTGFLCVALAGCPGTYSVDQADLELRDLPAPASQMLGLKACATTAWLLLSFLFT
jgi:hypothetical protein